MVTGMDRSGAEVAGPEAEGTAQPKDAELQEAREAAQEARRREAEQQREREQERSR